MALKFLRGYSSLWSVMVISERKFCGRYCYIRTYGHQQVTTMLFCFSDMIHSLNRVEEILVKILLDKEKQL